MGSIDAKYKEGNRSPELLYKLALTKMDAMDGSYIKIAEEYLATQSDWDTKENREFIYRMVNSLDSDMAQHIVDNKKDYEEHLGERAITGKIIPGGADHIVIRADGCIEIDARYCLQTDSGATIYVRDQGYRHGRPEIMQSLARAEAVNPTEYYFRTCMRLETADPVLSAINKMLFLGSACRTPEQVLIDLYKVH